MLEPAAHPSPSPESYSDGRGGGMRQGRTRGRRAAGRDLRGAWRAGEDPSQKREASFIPEGDAVVAGARPHLARDALRARAVVAHRDEALEVLQQVDQARDVELVARSLRAYRRHGLAPKPAKSVRFEDGQVDLWGATVQGTEGWVRGKLTVLWHVPDHYVNGGPKDQTAPVFAITPLSCDVQPNSSATFKLQFRPQSDQQYYVQTLECHCSFKGMRTFRLVSDDKSFTQVSMSQYLDFVFSPLSIVKIPLFLIILREIQ